MSKETYFKEIATKTIVEGYVSICGAFLRVKPPKKGEFYSNVVRLSLSNTSRDDRTYWFCADNLGKLIEHLTEIRDVLMEKEDTNHD